MAKLKPYTLAAIISLITLFLTFSVFKIDPRFPLNYDNDAIVHYNFAKNIQDTGWWATNPSYGAPSGQTLYGFPLTENLHLLIIKLLILLGLNWYQSVNVFFILTFPLTSVCALFVLQKLSVKNNIALPLSIIYAFIPYHLLRGVNHLFLSGYFGVPFSIYTAFLVANHKKLKLKWLLAITLLIASSGAYYTFLSLFLIAVGLLYAQIKKPSKKFAIETLKIFALILLFFFVNYLPTFIYTQKYGKNYNATVRRASETELYGLKISQLILPFEDHNLGFFNKIQKRYLAYGSYMSNENQYSALGITASAGFIFLLFWAIFRAIPAKFEKSLRDQLDILGMFTVTSVLFATVGGFATLLSTYTNPTFRSVNRISIFIAFIALVAVGLLAQRVKYSNKAIVLMWVLTFFALFDQISFGVMRNFTKNLQEFSSLREYAQKIESRARDNAKIFTLPIGEYPEGVDKKLLRVALLTDNITWSTGAETWRAPSTWQHKIYNRETKQFLESIIKEGFTGLLIDIKELEPEKLALIELELKESPLQDPQKEYSYYDLRTYTNVKKIVYSPTEIFHYISGNCLYDRIEKYYCVDSARIEFENTTSHTFVRSLRVELELSDGEPEEIIVQIPIPPGKSYYQINTSADKAVFPIPGTVPIWPLNLGYPNFIINEIRL